MMDEQERVNDSLHEAATLLARQAEILANHAEKTYVPRRPGNTWALPAATRETIERVRALIAGESR